MNPETINLIFIGSIGLLSLFIYTLLFKGKKTQWGNFWLVWTLVAVTITLSIASIIMYPNWIPDFITKSKEFLFLT